ncbi:MAG: hypothetical protein IPP34_05480 [Bacteroidetes bacterium]|nr:hypothetical protein [Bacteroidota bacterium]
MMGLYLKIAGIVLAISLFAINDSLAQKYFKASIDSVPNSILRKLTTESQVNGIEEGRRNIERILVSLYDYGFLAASADTFSSPMIPCSRKFIPEFLIPGFI